MEAQELKARQDAALAAASKYLEGTGLRLSVVSGTVSVEEEGEGGGDGGDGPARDEGGRFAPQEGDGDGGGGQEEDGDPEDDQGAGEGS